MESDLIGLQGGSYSTYSYTSDNPVSRIDPDGLQELVLPIPWWELIEPAVEPSSETGGVPTTVDPALPIPDTGQPPNDPNSPKCVALAQKISNIRQDIASREKELLENKLDLPERLPPSITQGLRRLDQRGHRQITRKLERRLRELEEQCHGECRCPGV